MLINEAETYGTKGNCLSINNSTLCHKLSVVNLAEDKCLNRILKEGSAKWWYKFTKEEIIESLHEDVAYDINFYCVITVNREPKFLNRTYLLQLSN